ncbi:DNA mismatch repair protein [Tissierella pigra]|uniref:DNA mismatch repair protein MutS n=1 Tax=Tissierella pigra TaxID=2607614 RepID=A0A6N7XZ53_9FIRM|nr:MutS family DNA mismatch repair protein [Tissierella pigra]MBU5426318.1 DNA mismatch repair protein [Tissierella pigra]MSU02733.1 DNA mismatch repair protein MutS [Tissierella pigra]
MIKDKFIMKIQKENENIEKYSKKSNLISMARFIVFIGIIATTYVMIKIDYKAIYAVIDFILTVIFIGLIIYHNVIKDRLNFSQEIININNEYLDRINGNWIDFNDIGEEFINKEHKYSFDLDIVGKKSLFQFINIANTWNGRRKLAKTLLESKYNKDEIYLRQEAIKELGSKLDFCQELEYLGRKHKEELQNPESLMEYTKNNEEVMKSQKIKKILHFLPIFVIPLSIGILVFKVKEVYSLIPLLILLQYLLWVIGFSKLNRILVPVGKFKSNLETYLDILKLLEKEKFESKKLKDLKEILFNKDYSSILGIEELDRITEKINLRYNNALIYFLFNGLFLWDYECAYLLENWKKKYGVEVEKWIEVIGEIEALSSLSVFIQIEEDISFPTIDNSKLKIKADSLGHPLINSDIRILNDIEMDNNIFIITGSNMSGKTTFLRTLGINLVLAYSGGPVYADKMSCPIVSIYTSMRVTDDLKNGISTFYAELLRIKDIINEAKENKNMIFLIDEIFRGTNSIDRILGAKNVLANLNKLEVIGAITTHDLELCVLDKYNRIKNYHFSEEYKDNKIHFDYKIRLGRSTSTNAKYLMKLVGIEIIDD